MVTKRLNKFIKDVESGKLVVGSLVKLAVDRFKKDLKKERFFFDADSATRAVDFIENYTYHTKGRWAGSAFRLEPWQVFIVANIFGFIKPDGTRRFSIGYTEIARKNGKSTLAAAIGIYCLVADKESGAEIYSAATKKDQARIVFGEAKRMINSSGELKRFAKVLSHSITIPETYSKFEALGADSDTLDGLNIHCAIIDELHAHKSRELWDVLLTATGARAQPLIFAITTAGFDKTEGSICWIQHEYSEKILKGEIADDSYFAWISCIDEGDDWQDPDNWQKANPNLHVTINIEDLKVEANRVKKSPTSLNPFLRYKMNLWTSAEKAWLTSDQWNLCNKGEIDIESLSGRACYVGMDLAKKIDTSALVLVFPPEDEDQDYIIIPYIFLPKDTLAEKDRQERTPWRSWAQRKLIYTTTGRVTNLDEIVELVDSLDARFDLKDIIYDRWRAPEIMPQLEDMGWCIDPKDSHAQRYLIEFGQGYRDMSPAIRNLEEIIIDGKLNHGGHEALAWQVGCVTLMEDDAGNVKFSKRKSKGKIDAVVAMAMAAYRAAIHKPEKSVYEERGILFF